MRFLIILLLTYSTACIAETANIGDYVIVRGGITGCEEWSHRVLDMVEIEHETSISLIGIDDIAVLNLSQSEIEHEEYVISLEAQLARLCPMKTLPGQWSPDEDMEKIRLRELLDRFVYSPRYNKAFKFVPALRAFTGNKNATHFCSA